MTGLAVTVEIPIAEYQALFEKVPGIAFFHLRDTMGGVFGSFRRTHLSRTQVRNARRFTFYRVSPEGNEGKKRKPGQTLEDIVGESLSKSEAALGLEVGGTIKPRKARFLAIPMGITRTSTGRIKKNARTPAKFAAGKRPKNLVVLPANAGQFPPNPNSRGLILFWRKGKGKKTRLVPAFRLVRQIKQRPQFKYMATWDSLKSDRDMRFRRGLDRATKEMARVRT